MGQEDWGVNDPENQYYFNMKTREVEQGKVSQSVDRVGPFKTREEALNAPELLAERSKKWADEEAAEE